MEKEVIIHIKTLLKEHNISLRELSRLTDIRHATLSQLSNYKRDSISFDHIKRIAKELNIDDINKIISLKNTYEEEE
jgi:putative transcriptional regulator